MQNYDVLYNWDTSQHIIDACVMVHTYHAQTLNLSCSPTSDPEEPKSDILATTYVFHTREINKQAPDYQALMPIFRWLPADVIQQTFAVTTQYAHLASHDHTP